MEEGREQQKSLQEEARFLGRVARKQTPGRQEDPAEFLLTMARLRLCLATAATLLQRATAQSQGEENLTDEMQPRQMADSHLPFKKIYFDLTSDSFVISHAFRFPLS